MNTHELAWAAGLFDGEGCIRTKPGSGGARTRMMQLQVMQADSQVLQRFADAVGIGKVLGPYEAFAKNSRQRPMYMYQVYNFEHVQAIIAMLWAFLSPVKRERCHAALDEYRTASTTSPRRSA